MNDHFEPIENLDALQSALEQSQSTTVVLFNHDPWCPISARAHREMSALEHPVLLVDVSRRRDVTAEIARGTGIRHESPQAFVIRNGAVQWSASHSAITASAVTAALVTAAASAADNT